MNGSPHVTQAARSIDRDGFAVLGGVYPDTTVDRFLKALNEAIDRSSSDASLLRDARGSIFAARNVLQWFPEVKPLWRTPLLQDLLTGVLGRSCGLVRVLYFDKPPDATWSLPWHKDLTIAVKEHRLDAGELNRLGFRNPTFKAGVPHLEATEPILRDMLTLRVHLDPVDDDNGPLSVIVGSHRSSDRSNDEVRKIHVGRGDVLAIRPLVSHSSQASRPGAASHRRVVHLEFAGDPRLPEPLEWHTFLPVGAS